MTKDRAGKRAARERAASTGERYVVARREAAEYPAGDNTRPRPRRHQGRPNRNEPRILIDWQNRIARLFGMP